MPTLSLGRTIFQVRWIKHCGWYPDYRQPQLFRKGRFRYRDELVHESFDCEGTGRVSQESALQYPFRDIDHYVAKQDRYSDLMARRMAGAGPAVLFPSTRSPIRSAHFSRCMCSGPASSTACLA